MAHALGGGGGGGRSTGPGTIAGNHEWEQIVELASGRMGDDIEGECEGERAELESGEAVLNVDDSKPLVEGWLAKQTILHSTTNRTPWRNRYFILKRGCIHYYDVIAEDAIHLKDFAVEHESSRLPIKLEGTEKFGYLLTLVFDQPIEGREAAGVKDDMANRMLYLAAESEEEKNNWLDWFVNVALGSESEQRKGWLMVRDKRTRAWKNRYFTLKGKTLHQHHRDQKPFRSQGIFPLAGAEVWSRDGFSFSVKARSGKILNLMADGQDVRDKWLRLILRVIKHYQANELHQTILEKEDYDMLDFTHKVKDWVDTERARVEKRVQDFLASGASCPPTSSPDGKFRILSIDGGGMRGLMNCILLSRLLMVFPDLFEKVNFWVGTSNGGMLAMAFAFGYSPALCRTLLELAGSKVFIKREGYTGVLNRAKFSSQALKILCDEVYGKLTLAQCPSFVLLPSLLLDNHAPDALQRACENRYYHNLPKRKDDRERRRRAVSFNTLRQRQQREQERRKREREAASQQAVPPPSEARPPSPALARKASSDSGRDEDHQHQHQHHHHQHHHHQQQQQEGPPSSPFFEIGSSPVDTSRPRPPPASFGGGGGPEYGEGEGEGDPRVNEMLSETASDLVMRTIAAPTYFPSHQQHVDGGMFAHDPASSALTLAISPYWLNKKLDEVVLLSFGTGKVNHYYEDDSHDWGYMQWVPKLAGVLWDGMIMQSEQMCHELLGDRYFRFNPVLQTEIPLDNPEAVPLLVDIALNIELGPLVAWVNENFYSTAAAKAEMHARGAASASDASSEEASPPAEGARGRVGSAQGRRVAFAASSSSSKAEGENNDASAEGDDHGTNDDDDDDDEAEVEGEGEEGERRRRSRMRQDQEGQVKREREAIEVWERREQEERERRERIERMEREKRERERRDREERERREQAERERVEREQREEREREQQRREAREREARERGDREARERQEAQEREAREEEERRQREVREREERERREREELEAIERRAQQMREIEEIERKAREERERLERARREEEEEAEREGERLLREAEAEEERRQMQEREERRRLREEEEARVAREAEERREREEKLLLEREAEEREAQRRQEEVKNADKQTRPVGGGGGMNFFEHEFTFEEAVLLAEEGAPLPPPGHKKRERTGSAAGSSQQQQQPPPHRRAGSPHTLAPRAAFAPVVVSSPVDDLFSFLTAPAGMGGGKNQDSSAGTTTTTSGGATSAVQDNPAAAAGGKKQPANLDDFFW
ncbi:PH domain containing protein [Acanthamoeba castellanii str. Neff]|uniref:PH domain containing protein n=1 Tax=Acanthamoeba castellanii (strain ATCC 30010 / Neff) TaxID=1257118 RepID=L8H6B7_ACACF|nr:PH domain containing protein [Acanthamoeba castellanii str. Neff]ELR20011.1 PH domain containing protein [Acanthamoeba castellanii str. Neff]